MKGGYIGKPIGGVVQTTNAGALTATLDAATLSATGVVALKAAAAITLDAATLSATGAVAIQGALTATLDDAAISAAAALALKGALSITLDAASHTAVGALLVKGNAGITLDDVGFESVGEFGQTITDTEVLQLPVDYVLAGEQPFREVGREWDIRPANRRETGYFPRSRVGRLKGDRPSFTVKTSKRGYD